MDNDCSICNERANRDMLFADSERSYKTKRPLCLLYVLLVLSYILILALFITVLYKTTSDSSQSQSSSAQLRDLTDKVLAEANSTRNAEVKLKENKFNIDVLKNEVQLIGSKSEKSNMDFEKLAIQVADIRAQLRDLEISSKNISCKVDWEFYRDSCYFFSTSKHDWSDARSMCKDKGADLVVINSRSEQKFINSIIADSSEKRFWIGLHDRSTEDDWEWVDGTVYQSSYKNWGPGEPNDAEYNEDCAHVQEIGSWNDMNCDYSQFNAICEQKLSA
ncbi:asialoglycoprotein receptor 1-like [Spea bombifrons]|uniref:asialoglycoprotein receptor 1-like n=1 Tax=Spea bombifrons TaxID=233779 RepID=UPI00234A268D|nr:asialoglycoprotein receptor 1-like [Spea bombifrons]